MDDYMQLKCVFPAAHEKADIVTAFLAELGFDMFEDSDDGLVAYISASSFVESDILDLSKQLSFDFTIQKIPGENWNREWEKDFPIIEFENIFSVRAPFHPLSENFKYTLTIEPDMSFGTGHHPTTLAMLQEMLQIDFHEKTVLDMGAGTGILSVMASFLGASQIFAVDNHERSCRNILLNCQHNKLDTIQVIHGSIEDVANDKFHVILANINRNILLQHMEMYHAKLHPQGLLIISGFLEEDVPVLSEAATKYGFAWTSSKMHQNWGIMSFCKSES